MGFNFLISTTLNTKELSENESKIEISETYYIKTKSFSAKMIETDQGYIVIKGSEAKKSLSNSCTETYKNMRRKLIETKILMEKEDKYIFVEDTIFNSPSAASNMILGRNSNGFTEWVNKEGLTFKEIQDSINS